MPPHLIMLAAVGAGLIAGYRMAHNSLKARERKQAAERAEREADKATSGPRDLGALVWDAEAGAYRPRPN